MPGDWESLFRGVVAGRIEAGTAVRAGPAEMWAELRPALAEAGLSIGQAGLDIVRELWSAAVARRTGYQRFAKAAPDALFSQNMVAPDMAIRPAEVRNLLPEYMVRFDLTYTAPDGTEATRTVTMRDSWRPGMTVGDVYDAVAEAAEGLGLDYGQGAVGFANLRPVTI